MKTGSLLGNSHTLLVCDWINTRGGTPYLLHAFILISFTTMSNNCVREWLVESDTRTKHEKFTVSRIIANFALSKYPVMTLLSGNNQRTSVFTERKCPVAYDVRHTTCNPTHTSFQYA